jgi:murein DD-endopeptidase MepM/ murein hydrolase activator NlpD
MRGPIYRYNTGSCRYERVKFSWPGAITYAIGLALCSAAMLIGLLLLHDYMVETELENSLRNENLTLEAQQLQLQAKLADADANLELLREKDRALHQILFASTGTQSTKEQSQDFEKILLTETSSFSQIVDNVRNNSDKSIKDAKASNEEFAQLFSHNFVISQDLPISMPIDGLQPRHIMSGFGARINPFHKGLYDHPGIDITVQRGTNVKCTANGKVITVKTSAIEAGYGNYVEIDHENGYITRYAHLEEISVKPGQRVNKGTVIAATGNSGGSVAPHLHYEIIQNNKNVDPVLFWLDGMNPLLHEQFIQVSRTQNQSLD